MLEQLVRTHHAQTYRLALILTKNPRDAEEVTQEAFRQVLARHAAKSEPELKSWLSRTVANLSLMRLRKHRHQQQLLHDDLLTRFFESGRLERAQRDWAARADKDDLSGLVHLTVDGLSEKFRWILTMHDVEGMSLDDIALTLGMSLGAVKSTLHRARLYVREAIDQHYGATA